MENKEESLPAIYNITNSAVINLVLSLLGSTDGRNCSGVELEEEKSDQVGAGDRSGFMVKSVGPPKMGDNLEIRSWHVV